MMMTMLNFDDRSLLVIVIETDNVERMKKADPVTLESRLCGGILPEPLFPKNFSILLAYESEDAELYAMAKRPPWEFVRWLERGRTWRENVDGKKNAFNLPKEKD